MQDNTTIDSWIESTRALSAALPFGDSQAKKIAFAAGQDGPAQELRHHALQLRLKLGDLKRAQFGRQRTLVDIEGLERELERTRNDLDRRRIEIDLAEKRWELVDGEKYIADALLECQAHQVRIDQLPPIATREDYERQEAAYWVRKLLIDIHDQETATGRADVGTIAALRQLGLPASRNQAGHLEYHPQAERLAYLGLTAADIPLLQAPQNNTEAP